MHEHTQACLHGSCLHLQLTPVLLYTQHAHTCTCSHLRLARTQVRTQMHMQTHKYSYTHRRMHAPPARPRTHARAAAAPAARLDLRTRAGFAPACPAAHASSPSPALSRRSSGPRPAHQPAGTQGPRPCFQARRAKDQVCRHAGRRTRFAGKQGPGPGLQAPHILMQVLHEAIRARRTPLPQASYNLFKDRNSESCGCSSQALKHMCWKPAHWAQHSSLYTCMHTKRQERDYARTRTHTRHTAITLYPTQAANIIPNTGSQHYTQHRQPLASPRAYPHQQPHIGSNLSYLKYMHPNSLT